eukprot:1140344-Pelagomonas_calceolata.AAC.3
MDGFAEEAAYAACAWVQAFACANTFGELAKEAACAAYAWVQRLHVRPSCDHASANATGLII